ncbi:MULTISPECIES: hypothetical protein [Sediminibacillus]|uniref:Uncharacterized protein n=1 Tax=Sediminibacillus halophilus TaxID=482461 RepID=A0A1G9V9U8_9BACI|nr:hypothetical protein [Sediminibacillus terrae]SDM68837.1 hypothetical protein SAMN05216244_3192 [Sediminibacillus halophilus]
MSKLFSKLIGVKSPGGPERVPVYCLSDYRCSSPYQGTYVEIGGKPVFKHCGC